MDRRGLREIHKNDTSVEHSTVDYVYSSNGYEIMAASAVVICARHPGIGLGLLCQRPKPTSELYLRDGSLMTKMVSQWEDAQDYQ